MGTKFYTKCLGAVTLIMATAMNLLAQAPPVTSIGSAIYADGTWSVPIYVSGFTNAANISIRLNYDATLLVYKGVKLNSGLVQAKAVITPTTDQSGAFKFSYTSATAIVLSQPVTKLAEIKFTVKPGIFGVQIPLIWSGLQGACEITPPAPNAFVPPITVENMSTYFKNGSLDIPGLPPITGPTPVIACAGDPVTFRVQVQSGNQISYKWQVAAGGSNTWTDIKDAFPYSGAKTATLSICPTLLSMNGNRYQCIVTISGTARTSNSALLTLNNCSVSGTLKYNNVTKDALAGFTVSIDGSSATTDASGRFNVTGLKSGTKRVSVYNNSLKAGFVNATDAGTVNAWVLNPYIIPNVKFLAGDVNNDFYITPLDAQSILKCFVKDKPLPKPEWVFWNAIGSGKTNPPQFTVTLNGATVTGFDILAMCTGDFNSSFTPNGSGSSNILLTQGSTITVPSGTQFDLPLKAGSNMQVGAISLILNIPSKLVTVKYVKVNGSSVPVTYKVLGNEVRIGWTSNTPVNAVANADLVVLSLMPTSDFTKTQTLSVGLVPNSLNELADGSLNINPSSELIVDKVTVKASGGGGTKLVLGAYPNPANNSTTVTYQLPVDGRVSLGFFNSMGIPKIMLVNSSQQAGTYSQNVYVCRWPRGTYYIVLMEKTNNNLMVETLKFVKN